MANAKPAIDVKKRAENQQKLLFEIIKRYDVYISATNTKIAVILSYCIAYIGAISFKIIDLSGTRSYNSVWWIALGLATLSALATFVAANRAYAALNPQTPSGRGDNEAASVVFFLDVAGMSGGRDGYVNRIKTIEDPEIVEDLARQTFVLASIVGSKMKILNRAIGILIKYQLPLSFVTIVALFFTRN